MNDNIHRYFDYKRFLLGILIRNPYDEIENEKRYEIMEEDETVVVNLLDHDKYGIMSLNKG